MQSLVDALSRAVDGVFAVDSNQRVTFWNAACSRLLGIPEGRAMGRACCDVIKGHDPLGNLFCQTDCCVSRLDQGKRAPKTFPLWTHGPDGKVLKLSVSIVLVPSRYRDAWSCMHLLHRDPYFDLLEEMDVASSGTHRPEPGGTDDAGAPAPSPLSPREAEVARLMAEGLSTKTIAGMLDIRTVTVRNHIQHIEEKLGVHSKMEAVAYVYRHNLLG